MDYAGETINTVHSLLPMCMQPEPRAIDSGDPELQ